MLTIYKPENSKLSIIEPKADALIPADAIWYDLHEPTTEEVRAVEAGLGIDVPTRDEMQEIEASSRLRSEEKLLIMTATVISNADSDRPEAGAITFILSDTALITLRYSDPHSFRAFQAMARRNPRVCTSAERVFAGLMEAIIDRIADILEHVAGELDGISHDVFSTSPQAARRDGKDLKELLRRIGHSGDVISKARESLVSLSRLITFLLQENKENVHKGLNSRLKTMARDAHSLSDQASFEASNVNLLLNATLGMISIEQNAIVKTFSVAAVAFLPPTLIASIYGMNFRSMPELGWSFGYYLAIGAMILSALLPLLYFRRRGWL
jgi:magnesium transporter